MNLQSTLIFALKGLFLAVLSQAQADAPLAELPLVKDQWVAFGDSYSAGVGAGSDKDVTGGGHGGGCKRRTGAFPVQLERSNSLNPNGGHVFNFLACSGNTITDMLGNQPNSQISTFTANSVNKTNYATLTIDGNDVGFGAIALACLFCWKGNCDTELANADTRLQTIEQDLARAYTAIVDAVASSGGPRPFLLHVMGYVRFFSEETHECDRHRMGKFIWHGRPLTKRFRKTINDLVDATNSKIRSAIEMVNVAEGYESVRFIDVDRAFEGHRFCEEGQTQPDDGPNTRIHLLRSDDSFQDIEDTGDQPEDISPADCKAVLAIPNPAMGEEMGRVIWCTIH
ncbi:SGNH hydrolase [Aulographum hederae CBS 113979]|uniref:SGNH hydrolase n=1 Tax=Aulographum hederae CBS 113979 TaxID=1176131 RepID=A0A6G1H522_9PEZI|nr:SGNH hydrolase [Aulographum hederae CBS 113979]